MKLSFCLCLTLYFFPRVLHSELFKIYTLVELTYKADLIVEANLLKNDNGDYVFKTNKLGCSKCFDTIILKDFLRYGDLIVNPTNFHQSSNVIKIEPNDKILLFLCKNSKQETFPIFTGIRLNKADIIYNPVEADWNGALDFKKEDEVLTWEQLITRVLNLQARLTVLKKIRDEQDLRKRNKLLFKWYNQNKGIFDKIGTINGVTGWADIEWRFFQWLTEANIAKDTWQASVLYREIRRSHENRNEQNRMILNDYKGNSFNSYSKIKFLMNIAIDPGKDIYDRRQALVFLKNASAFFHKETNSIWARSKQQREKLKLLKQIKPLTHQPDLCDVATDLYNKIKYYKSA